jgi:ABC-type amino acid transport substrate-binding protein
MKIKDFYLFSLLALLTSTPSFSEDIGITALVRQSDGKDYDFKNLQDARNPYSKLAILNPEILELPPERANRKFCSGDGDLIYPVVGDFSVCEALIFPVSEIEIVSIKKIGNKNTKTAGIPLGYEDQMLKTFYPNTDVIKILSNESMLLMVDRNRIDLALFERGNLLHLINKTELDINDFVITKLFEIPASIAVSPDRPDIIKTLNNEN